MHTSSLGSKNIEYVVPCGEAEPPLYRSRYGGLWTDRRDAHDILQARLARSEVTEADAETLAHYIDHGYVVFPKATDEKLIDDYVDVFEATWDAPPPRMMLQWKTQVLPMERTYYDEIAKVSEVHKCFPQAGELIFPPPVLRFLTQIYERPPVAFQTITMRKGSEENLHIDSGPLTLTEPMSLAGSWVALEDVQPQSGEFQFVPGSHRLPELLHYGTNKGHNFDYQEYDKILRTTLRMCEELGLETERFMAKKGDVLIWHGDLMHGGAPIEDHRRTRKSLIAHVMPLGVMPTFYDFSQVNAVPYAGGGYCLDRLLFDVPPRKQGPDAGSVNHNDKIRPIDVWRSWVPLSIRQRIPPSVGAWARARVPHRSQTRVRV